MNLPSRVGGWLGSFLFPPVCVGCGRMAAKDRCLCLGCKASAAKTPSHPVVPMGLEMVACGPLVTDATRALVHGLKYKGHRRAAFDLVEIAKPLVDAKICSDTSVLVPVPLHPHRKRERGYNQSLLLAREWGQILSNEVCESFLDRAIDTSTQTRLGANQRRKNLEGAFRAGKGFRKGVPIVLVDDVLTTGATLSSCAAALLSAGALSVSAICAVWAGEA